MTPEDIRNLISEQAHKLNAALFDLFNAGLKRRLEELRRRTEQEEGQYG